MVTLEIPTFGRIAATRTLLAMAALLGAATGAHTAEADASLRADLNRVAARHTFMGHQSVGANVLEGLVRLSVTAGRPLSLTEGPAGGGGPAGIRHTFLGENGKPIQKLQAFEALLSTPAGQPDIALMKFCYLDFTPGTDVAALFARYRAMVDGVRGRYPRMTIVHVTAPLTTVQGGPKAMLKRWLGKPPYGAIENQRRDDYNTLLRKTYGGREPIFDLARVESTAPDGSAVSTEWQGRKAPSLAPAFTDDGGHLNAAGQARAARELVAVLAAIPNKP